MPGERIAVWVMGVVCVSIFAAAPARAGMIELIDTATGQHSGWVASWDDDDDIVLTTNQIIDDTVFVEKFTTIVNPPLNQVFPPATIRFEQVQADALPFIAIADDIVINDTGFSWIGFRFEVEAVEGGAPQLDADRTAIGFPGGFAIDPFNGFEYMDDDQVLELSHGLISSEPGENVWFAGVGPGSLFIQSAPEGETFTRFDLHQVAVIPLPPAGWAGLFTLLGLAAVSKARQLRQVLVYATVKRHGQWKLR